MPVKVAHVVTRLDLGGAQQNTLYTVRHLDRSRFEPLLICGEGGFLDAETKADPSFRKIFISSLVRPLSPWRDLRALFELKRIFQVERPLVVHTHSSKAGILGRLAAKWAGVPILIHTFHGFGFHDRQNPLVKWAYIWAERFCARFSTALIFVSRANQDYANRHGLRAPETALIRSGVALAALPAQVDKARFKAAAGIGIHKPLVLSIGNLKPQKNPGDFLAAASKVLAQLPETRFVFIGDGPQRRLLEARTFALGLNDKVLWLGWRRDAAQWLACADVFVMSSLWEGLPRALVEAMKSGLPCVCYAADGIRDILRDGENGFLVAPGDAEALAERLALLLRDADLRQRLGKSAMLSIGPEFEIGQMVRDQERLYAHLLTRAHD